MHRSVLAMFSAAAFASALALPACTRKSDEPVVAAPLTSPAPDTAPAGPGPVDPGAALPPGHPSLDGAPSGGAGGDAMGGDAMGGMPPPPHGAAMSAGPDVGEVKVAKAEGKDARTVAEVFAQRKALAGKAVAVRGKVVKYNPGIMGKNWVHLRDGTGTAAGKDNDVTVTTQDAVERGQVVTVRGTVAIDRDIGMGGAPYPVIIEDAKVSR